ncbi:MAG TPA: DUF4255 domain-containing protein [Gammaproteobacteria bacterium]|nr:DUF4255 domain-containing protein [Gammaproteobacteria bacterium]
MSSPAALATVTATLQHLLSGVATTVTTQPPSAARSGTGEQLNIFLYSTHTNSAFSNAPLPGRGRSGESSPPPLPLVLKYLLTAYGNNDDDISGQQVMGRAMSILHDHPLLGPTDITGVTPDSELQQQVERVRITPDTLSLDDMSKLWSSFQSAEYRLSTGYEVSVILIDSTRPSRTPLPVLKRGANDQGATVIAGNSPTLTGLRLPRQKPAAEYGDTVTLLGVQLSSDDTTVRFAHPMLDTPLELSPEITGKRSEMNVILPTQADDPSLGAQWPAGFYTVSLRTQRSGAPAWLSNAVALPLAPRIESISPTSAPAGDVSLTLECLPQIKEGQQVTLLFGDRSITPGNITTPADPTANSTLTFTVEDAAARTTPYVLRLRVDGVDSIPVDFSGSEPQFASNQQVSIT